MDNKKLAEWAGFRQATQEEYSPSSFPQPDMDKRGWGWMYPDGKIKWYLPNFTESLDACFKWLVPKVKDYVISFYPTKVNPTDNYIYWYVTLQIRDEAKMFTAQNKNPALALCLAIEALIDGGNGGSKNKG